MVIRSKAVWSNVSVLALMLSRHAVAHMTRNCCEKQIGQPNELCCPRPSLRDLALERRVILDRDRCCPHPNGNVWCAPYNAGGCSLCKDSCDGEVGDCVECNTDLRRGRGGQDDAGNSVIDSGEEKGGEMDNDDFGSSGDDGLGSIMDNSAPLDDSAPSLDDSAPFLDDSAPLLDDSAPLFYDSATSLGDSVPSFYSEEGTLYDTTADLPYSGEGNMYDTTSGSTIIWDDLIDVSSHTRSTDDTLYVEWDYEAFWRNDFSFALQRWSYSFSYELHADEYDCSVCSWDSMTTLEQRLLKQRSRSLICDTTCLTSEGHEIYGVQLCNYFNAGRECRACCHEGSVDSGCMPCEETCDLCLEKIMDICEEDACGAECEAYICCTIEWSERSNCEDVMFPALAQVADDVAQRCGTVWTCDPAESMCSESPDTCIASGIASSDSQHLTSSIEGICSTVTIVGAGSLDADYMLTTSLNDEIVFSAINSSETPSVLQSTTVNICEDNEDVIAVGVAEFYSTLLSHRSSSVSLVSDEETLLKTSEREGDVSSLFIDSVSSAMTSGGGEGWSGTECQQHVWYLHDRLERISFSYITVDPSEDPRYISAKWVKVEPTGEITLSNLTLSCSSESTHGGVLL